jgi:hypothetical protein
MPRFDLSNLPELEKWLDAKTKSAVHRGLVSAAFRTLGVIQNELIPAENPQPVDRDVYRAGWRVETTEKGADLVNDLPYAPVIEWGARAENIKIGRAMIQALAEWAKRKGFSPPNIPKGGDPQKGWESIAWAIATAMKKTGIFNRGGLKGLRIGEKAVKRLRAFLHEEVAREMKRG